MENKKKIRNNNFYTNKIHNDDEFYQAEKKRVVAYIKNRYENDEEFREKRKEYCKIKMKELYDKRKQLKNEVI